jgi:hypothetical protein
MTVEAASVPLRLLDELEDHGKRGRALAASI